MPPETAVVAWLNNIHAHGMTCPALEKWALLTSFYKDLPDVYTLLCKDCDVAYRIHGQYIRESLQYGISSWYFPDPMWHKSFLVKLQISIHRAKEQRDQPPTAWAIILTGVLDA